MKKEKQEVKKLRFSKETLRALESSDIQKAVGGTEDTPEHGSCNSWCICLTTRTGGSIA